MLRPTKPASDHGFTLMETLVALIVLLIGVLATALLAGRCMNTSHESKYMNLAAELASEKLEDLNRWDVDDPQICVPAGSSSVGSLSQDIIGNPTTCPPPLNMCSSTGNSAVVNYYDDVCMATVNSTDCPNPTYGCFSETVSSPGSGSTILTTTTHAPDGTITVTNPTTMPSPTFHRRWVIEANTPVAGDSAICLAGTRRVTVLVTLMDQTVQPPVTFQMSMVRP
jgi:prepilin-type N-terminal cleavage/methylation domain-containing protein